jgi:hypothetical protein
MTTTKEDLRAELRAASVELKQLHDKCKAQAAVIERVEAVTHGFETCTGYDMKHRAECRRVAKTYRAALAAAPEHTPRQDIHQVWEAMGQLTSYLIDGKHMVDVDDVRHVFERATAPEHTAQVSFPAANARIAELEGERINLLDQRDNQRARADTQTVWVQHWKEQCDKTSGKLFRAESEAASLRAELRERTQRYEIRIVDLEAAAEKAAEAMGQLNNAWHQETMRKLAAESRLAAATELLRDLRGLTSADGEARRLIDAFLSSTPAPSEHTAPKANEPGAPHDLLKQVEQARRERDASNARAEAAEERAFERNAQLMRAETEAAALRAGLERLRNDSAVRSVEIIGKHNELAAATALLDRLGHWADGYGTALVPHGGAADTYGDGVRACKRQVKDLLSSTPAPSERAAAERKVLEAALAWHRLDTSVNTEALHHYCGELALRSVKP